MNSRLVRLLSFCSLVVSPFCTTAQSDTIFAHNVPPVGVELIGLDAEAIRYRMPGQVAQRAIGRAAVYAVKYKSGELELVSEMQSLGPDWSDSRPTELHSAEATLGLTPISKTLGKTQGWISLHSIRTAERTALRRVRKYAVLNGAPFFRIVRRVQSGAGLINQSVIEAELYTYPHASSAQANWRKPFLHEFHNQNYNVIATDIQADTLILLSGIRIPILEYKLSLHQLIYRPVGAAEFTSIGRCAVSSIKSKQSGYSNVLPFVDKRIFPSEFFHPKVASSLEAVKGLRPAEQELLFITNYSSKSKKNLEKQIRRIYAQLLVAGVLSNFNQKRIAVVEQVDIATASMLLNNPAIVKRNVSSTSKSVNDRTMYVRVRFFE